MTRNWFEYSSCPICGRRLGFIYPKDKMWDTKWECPNKCYATVYADGEHTIMVHEESKDSLIFTISEEMTLRDIAITKNEITKAIVTANLTWIRLTKETSE